MDKFQGFPSGMRNIPIPSLLISSLIEDIEDIAEIRCTLRFFWHIAQIKGIDRSIDSRTLLSDQLLVQSLGSISEIKRGLSMAVQRGTLLSTERNDGSYTYFINNPEGRSAIQKASDKPLMQNPKIIDNNFPHSSNGLNIFQLYESNIGALTPMISDELRDAETIYPLEWIEMAIRESVENNARSWRYVSRVLERWLREGKKFGTDGKLRRNPQTLTAAEYRRKTS